MTMTTTTNPTLVGEIAARIAERRNGSPGDYVWAAEKIAGTVADLAERPLSLPTPEQLVAPFYDALLGLHDTFQYIPTDEIEFGAEFGELTDEARAIRDTVVDTLELLYAVATSMIGGDARVAAEGLTACARRVMDVDDVCHAVSQSAVERMYDASRLVAAES